MYSNERIYATLLFAKICGVRLRIIATECIMVEKSERNNYTLSHDRFRTS